MPGTTIIEYQSFRTTAPDFLSTDDIEGLADYLSQLPSAGNEVEGLHGLRVLSWPLRELGREPKGTVGYYFISERQPLHLIGCFSRTTKNPASKALELAFAEHI